MSRRLYSTDLTLYHKLIVGEGESDRNFLAAFCAKHGIASFDYAFTGIHNPDLSPSGFDCFKDYLPVLHRLAGFSALTDVVLVCDSTDNRGSRLTQLRTQIREANRQIGSIVFSETPDANVLATAGAPRVHVLLRRLHAMLED